MTQNDESVEKVVKLAKKMLKKCAELEALALEVSGRGRGDCDLDDAAEMYFMVSEIVDRLGFVQDEFLAVIERERGKREFVALPDGNAMELGYSQGSKSWAHDRLKPVVIDAIIDSATDKTTGEITVGPRELLEGLMDVVAPSYWRSTQLDAYNIDANDYVTKRPRRFKAKIHKN